ncbi:MAG: helix-turn-helix transcriptional regulator [Mollicutes bacterium]|nr:helix-turn-helix transcriptional regulator [Mollicutes bacterium]
MDLDKIGKFIKYLRAKKGLSQEELASKINVTNKAISRWECGNGLPGTSLLEPLSKELDISISALLDGQCTNNVVEKSIIKSKKHLIFLIILIILILILMMTIYYCYNNFYGFDNSYFIILKNNFSYLPFSNILSLFITKNYLIFIKNIFINCVIGTFISAILIILGFNKNYYLIVSNFLFELIKWFFFLAIFDIDDIFIRVITGFLILYIYAYKKISLF